MQKIIDPYRKISINNVKLKVNKAIPRETVSIKIYPLNSTISELRFWSNNELIDIQRVKNSIFKGVHF